MTLKCVNVFWSHQTNRLHIVLCTIELGLGQDATTDRITVLPIADIKGRDGRMVGHLAEERERHVSNSGRKESDTL